ncbi:unnamed protein product [Somion occarium]|uniref:J domain-containing protein n=1 Tax=Somion occarium TaxID=3059160 RepID=A0ABP1DWI6_9APHY
MSPMKRMNCTVISLVRRRIKPQVVIQIPQYRHASTSANPYPFPGHPNPTPHQIFHLPRNASKGDVKARYYDLVRIYHPDSPVNRMVSPAIAQARFQSIGAAYDVLRGKGRATGSDPDDPASSGGVHDYHDLSTAMWRAKQGRRADLNGGIDERWKDRLILGGVVLTIAGFVAQTYSTRRHALSAAFENAREDPFVRRSTRSSVDDSALTSDVPPTKHQ